MLAFGAVLVVDAGLGTLTYDFDTPPIYRFETARAGQYDVARAAQIQRDGGAVRFVRRDGIWRLTPTASQTVNIDETGVRKTVANEPGGMRIAFVGGSAAFGLGQGDDRTVASELARILNTDGGSPVEIVNLGTPSWTTTDAALDLMLRIQRGEHFDAVIAYAGANELYMGFLQAKVPVPMLDVIERFTGSASSTLLEHWFDRSLVARLSGRRPRPGLTPLRVSDPYIVAASREPLSTEMVGFLQQKALYNYKEGDRMLRELAERHDFHLMQVLQPLATDGTEGFFAVTKPLMAEQLPGALDLSGSLPPECFYDNIHTAEPCSARIAAFIAKGFRSTVTGADASG